jgi:hypothetical protein
MDTIIAGGYFSAMNLLQSVYMYMAVPQNQEAIATNMNLNKYLY